MKYKIQWFVNKSQVSLKTGINLRYGNTLSDHTVETPSIEVDSEDDAQEWFDSQTGAIADSSKKCRFGCKDTAT